jgi:hypothetical protein
MVFQYIIVLPSWTKRAEPLSKAALDFAVR